MSTLELIAVLATVWFIGLPLLIVGGILAWQADARRRTARNGGGYGHVCRRSDVADP